MISGKYLGRLFQFFFLILPIPLSEGAIVILKGHDLTWLSYFHPLENTIFDLRLAAWNSCSRNWWMNPKVKKMKKSWFLMQVNQLSGSIQLCFTCFLSVQKHPNRRRLQSPPANPWFKHRHTSGWYWPGPHHWFQRSKNVFECNMQQSTMIIPNFYDNLSWQSHDEPTYAI